MVTLKLVTTENESCYAHTYVRSLELSNRDFPERHKYAVGSGENAGFDQALAEREDGLPSHFYSPNLGKSQKANGYTNQRAHFIRFYNSTLIIPIRALTKSEEKAERKRKFDLIGFLCVDTLSTNRLNNGFHLFILSALADQMYNFMSLMRGKYTVTCGDNNGETN